MIHFVASSDPRFKAMTFASGFNVVLADVTEQSTNQHSRNASGKTSLTRVMHFLLGGNSSAGSFFHKPDLVSHSFALGLDVGGTALTVVRSGSDPGVHLVKSDSRPIEPGSFPQVKEAGEPPRGWEKLTLAQWRDRLATDLFGLSPQRPPFSPSPRSLLSYLIRRENDEGFRSPFRQSRMQQAWDVQVSLSYFLDLDWTIPAAFEAVRKDEQAAKAFKKAAKGGELGVEVGSVAELRTELAVTRQHSLDLRRQADQFTVVEEYERSEQEADQLTRELRDLRDDDAVDRDLIADIENAEAVEAPPDAEQLERLWSHANVILPESVRSSYEDVLDFHASVIRNRQLYLEREATLARQRIAERSAIRARIDSRRSELMQLLSTGGALQQFVALEAEVARVVAEVKDLERRYELAEKFETTSAAATRRRQDLLLRLQGDHHDRSQRLDRAIVLFEEYSRSLYDQRRGSLVVRETLKGPEFDVEIAGKGSVGIDSMQILCFDLTVLTLLSERDVGAGFLVHDSHLFDGVDERQTASALQLAQRLAEEQGFQYIATMNSDMAHQVSEVIDLGRWTNPVRLVDNTEDGGLFGFRFD